MSKAKGEISRRQFLEIGAGTAGMVLVASAGCSESDSEEDTDSEDTDSEDTDSEDTDSENTVQKKVLVTYYSQTGNTEIIATAISEEASLANETVLKKIEEVSPDDVGEYDVIFIGSPIHGNNLNGTAKNFLAGITSGSGQKVAGFVTHCASSYSDQEMVGITEPLRTACQDNGMEYKGCFNCQGALEESLYEIIKAELDLPEDEWDEWVIEMKRHPDEDDAINAKAFAKEVMA